MNGFEIKKQKNYFYNRETYFISIALIQNFRTLCFRSIRLTRSDDTKHDTENSQLEPFFPAEKVNEIREVQW